MNTPLADTLNKAIDRHAGGQLASGIESQDLEGLSRRLLCSVNAVKQFLADGILVSQGPVHRGDETGLHTFKSDDLNDIRRAVLTAVVERVIDESSGDPSEISIAAGDALRNHVAGFAKKPAVKTELSRFPTGLVQFASPYDDNEQPGPIQQAATTAAKVGAIGAAGYGAASLVRGRMLKPGARLIDQLRAGSAANIATARGVVGTLSSGADKIAAILAGKRLPLPQ